MRLYQRIENPPEGTELQYLGCYIMHWQHGWTEMLESRGAKLVGFVEVDDEPEEEDYAGS